MKKQTAAFIISAVVLSAVLQAVFAFYVIKTTGLDRFIYMRKIVEKNARLSAAAADSFMEFKNGPDTAILAMPACDLNKAMIPGSFDFFVMHTDHDTCVFSLYPSPISARKHGSLYMKNIRRLEYSHSGGLFGFKCDVNGALYGRSFFINPGCSLLPADAGVF